MLYSLYINQLHSGQCMTSRWIEVGCTFSFLKFLKLSPGFWAILYTLLPIHCGLHLFPFTLSNTLSFSSTLHSCSAGEMLKC